MADASPTGPQRGSSRAKDRVSAAPEWFRIDAAEPVLLGTRCASCGSVFFPPRSGACRNPACGGDALEALELSRRGRLWSYTNSCYPPPPPYRAAEPFEPFAVAAVELEAEGLVVLGQVVEGVGVDALSPGLEMELAQGTLFEDEERAYVVWKWRPVR